MASFSSFYPTLLNASLTKFNPGVRDESPPGLLRVCWACWLLQPPPDGDRANPLFPLARQSRRCNTSPDPRLTRPASASSWAPGIQMA
ncbi:hypothetical protein CPLU01_01226 [Colletotrichum plurivorum]|uniref:Uncharacterized protein n=1 Tax=Colletotrichum plurivorum TaxID=2175906 RepID=A0A8H6NPK2_9PEZI|nr:hypothetical protein CPLU01_01226 [Colletotrichum plurivorum]